MGAMKDHGQNWADRIADADPHQGGRELRERMAGAHAAGLSFEDIEAVSAWPAAVVAAIVADIEAGKVHAFDTYALTDGVGAECACGEWAKVYPWTTVRPDRRPGVVTSEDHDKARDLAAVDHPAGGPTGDSGKVEGETVTEWAVRYRYDTQPSREEALPNRETAAGVAALWRSAGGHITDVQIVSRTVIRSPWKVEG